MYLLHRLKNRCKTLWTIYTMDINISCKNRCRKFPKTNV